MVKPLHKHSSKKSNESFRHKLLLFISLIIAFAHASAQTSGPLSPESLTIEGQWYFNQDLSDVTDRKVEEALKAMGQKIERRLFDRRKDRYRGGPADQELYDRLSYDQTVNILLEENRFLFTYDDNFKRPVYLDNRSRSISLTALNELEDFSFAHWEENDLLVEGRPRDGGFSNERYSLSEDGLQLNVEMYIMPGSFTAPVELTRVYTRSPTD